MPEIKFDQALQLILQTHAAGKVSDARHLFERLQREFAGQAQPLFILGLLARQCGWRDDAIRNFLNVLELNPAHIEACFNLAFNYEESGEIDRAQQTYERLFELAPAHLGTIVNLADLLAQRRDKSAAREVLREGLKHLPTEPVLLSNLGLIENELGNVSAAEQVLRKALANDPACIGACRNLGTVLLDSGRIEEAIQARKRTLDLTGCDHGDWSDLLLSLNYSSSLSAEAISAEHRKYGQSFPFQGKRYNNPSSSDRILRIGYVSPDFRFHVVSSFFLPLLRSHDRTGFHITCYSNSSVVDNVTRTIQTHADQWRQIDKCPDEQVEEMLRADAIDILVDLAGHTSLGRVPLFARKPVPVQVSFLGYPNTVGITQVDARLTDIHADPPGVDDSLYTESLIRLPRTAWCFSPLVETPEVSPSPAQANGFITFGCLNNFAKLNERWFSVWARVMNQVRHSRLVLKATALADADVRRRLIEFFEMHGIREERLILLARTESYLDHLKVYHSIDLAFDSYPYHGTTTTCESLWMGVPVLTKAGARHASRVGVSLLANVGLPSLVAESDEDFISKAVSLNVDQLAELRRGLRHKLQASPLMNGEAYARDVEKAYRDLWLKYCQSQVRSV